jgi:hypothetical protein
MTGYFDKSKPTEMSRQSLAYVCSITEVTNAWTYTCIFIVQCLVGFEFVEFVHKKLFYSIGSVNVCTKTPERKKGLISPYLKPLF